MSTGVLHDAAGLAVAADTAIPGLPLASVVRAPDVHVHVESRPPWHTEPFLTFHRSHYTNLDGLPIVAVRRNPNGFHFSYADGTDVWMDREGREIWCMTPPGATLADTATYLTGPVLGFALRLRGALALHASAVSIDGRALLMVGPHGAGKSTTAAALTARGGVLIADDISRVRKGPAGWVVETFAAGLRLWPDAVAMLLGENADLPRITPTWDKRFMHAAASADSVAPVPVASVAFLEDRTDDEPRLAGIGAAESVVRLATHSSASHLLDDHHRAEEFSALTDLVQRVRCIRAVPSSRSDRLPAFAGLLLQWTSDAAR